MDYELEFAEGLVKIVRAEVAESINDAVQVTGSHRPDALQVHFQGDPTQLERLRTVNAIYQRLTFEIPRPKALLGHQHFHRLLDAIRAIRSRYADGTFQTLHISAAGSDSSVMMRLKDELAQSCQLTINEDGGDLLLRIRRTPGKKKRGWDVLIRTTPRPLATRDWRVCNLPGALDAAVAYAMLRVAEIRERDVVVNLACGSATLLIEAALMDVQVSLIGVDIDSDALACAAQNIGAIGQNSYILLLQADAESTPLRANSADCLLADLPFGQLVGSHDENLTLYPAILRDAARIARIGAYFVVIAHEVRLMQSILKQSSQWMLREEIMVTLSGLHPRIFVLERV